MQADRHPGLPARVRDSDVVARQVRLCRQLGAHLGQLEFELTDVVDGRAQDRQSHARRMRRLESCDLLAQLDSLLVQVV